MKNFIKQLQMQTNKFEIDKIREINLNKNFTAFDGIPGKNPLNENVLILLDEPFVKNSPYYEFSIDSLGHVEDISTITSKNGQTAFKVRVWVKKGMTAIRSRPFGVE